MNKLTEARRLLVAKAREYGLHVAAEHILTALALAQREIEEIQNTPQDRKRSVFTEQNRERYQKERRIITHEIDGLVALIDLYE